MKLNILNESSEYDRGLKDGFDAGRKDRGHNEPYKKPHVDKSYSYGDGYSIGYEKGYNSHPRDNDLYGDLR